MHVFEKWLAQQPVIQPDGALSYETLADSGELPDEELVDYLGRELVRNYVGPGELAMIFDDLGAPEVAAHLRLNKFPADLKVRHGDFGEVVTGALYRRVRRWCVPVLKLRFKQTPNQAVQGTDVLAFRFRQDPPVIAVPEVKTRATRTLDLGLEAHASLEKVLARLDESITFMMARSVEQGHRFLARHLAALLRKGQVRVVERHMVFVHDDVRWREEIVDRLAGVVTNPTQLTVVRIRDLQPFIARVYQAAEAGPAASERKAGAE